MRIVAGKFRGKRIAAPKNLPVRPTTDMAKESLFNILAHEIDWPEVKALDLFAGTGNISYEMASRGCEDILCVDWHRGCIQFIEKTAESMGIDGLRVRQADAFNALSIGSYDFIFADPPYGFERHEILVQAIMGGQALKPGGLFVLEHGPEVSYEDHPKCRESRKYGSVHFSFFSHLD